MEIFLIRHTTPLVAKGVCYGQTDLDVTDTFLEEAAIIKQYLPNAIEPIYSSPLQRCKKLAEHLFTNTVIKTDPRLMELNCGLWEMQRWDDIPRSEIDPWMSDFVNVSCPQGESYVDLHTRVVNSFENICNHNPCCAIVAHGGVLRSILSHITQTPLVHSFNAFKLHYGCVVKITRHEDKGLRHQILSNIAPEEKEQHKPNYF